jgi:hypothetical protein
MIGLESNAFSRQFLSGFDLANAEVINGEQRMASDLLNFQPPLSPEAISSAIVFSSALWVAIGFVARYWLV